MQRDWRSARRRRFRRHPWPTPWTGCRAATARPNAGAQDASEARPSVAVVRPSGVHQHPRRLERFPGGGCAHSSRRPPPSPSPKATRRRSGHPQPARGTHRPLNHGPPPPQYGGGHSPYDPHPPFCRTDTESGQRRDGHQDRPLPGLRCLSYRLSAPVVSFAQGAACTRVGGWPQ